MDGPDTGDAFLGFSASTLAALSTHWDANSAPSIACFGHNLASNKDEGETDPSDTSGDGNSASDSLECLDDQVDTSLSGDGLDFPTFKTAFPENWQLSQFWYDHETAKSLAEALARECRAGTRIAFICCPSAFVAFQSIASPTSHAYLFEKDLRFSAIAAKNFVEYDLTDPCTFNCRESATSGSSAFEGLFDIAVVDPPFHSAVSQANIALTCKYLLRSSANARGSATPPSSGGPPRERNLVLLTGTALEEQLPSVYIECGRLRRARLEVKHGGVGGGLANAYGCWVTFQASAAGVLESTY